MCALIANINRKKGTPTIKAEEFMPPEIKAPTRSRRQTPDQMMSVLMAMAKPKDGKTTKRKPRNG